MPKKPHDEKCPQHSAITNHVGSFSFFYPMQIYAFFPLAYKNRTAGQISPTQKKQVQNIAHITYYQ